MTKAPAVLLVGLNYTPEPTGVAPYTSGLARSLVREGLRTRVITSFPHYPQWSFGPEAPPRFDRRSEEGVVVERRRHMLPRRPGGLWRALSEITFGLAAARSRIGRPDVAILVSPALLSSAVFLVRLRLKRRVPVVVWVQDLYSLGLRELSEGSPRVAGRAVAAVERWVLRNADAVVVIHERFKQTLEDELGVNPAKVTVVRNWSHLEDGHPTDLGALRRSLGWSDDDFVVLHAGNMGLKQDLFNVVNAAKEADASGSAVRFVLVGDGSQRAALEAASADVSAMSIIGPLSAEIFQDVLRAADALLVNERAGVTGMAVPSKLTSYFSAGRPVIAATDAGGITESEIHLAGAGVVVTAGDPLALLRAAEQLRSDPGRAAQLGSSGRRFRINALSADASFRKFRNLLDGIIHGRWPITSTGNGSDLD